MKKSKDMTDEILAKLNAFGDSLLEGSSSSKVTSKKRKKDMSIDEEGASNEKRKKKKKKKNQEQCDAVSDTDGTTPSKRLKGEKRHLAELRAHLGLSDLDTLASDNDKNDVSPPVASQSSEHRAKQGRRVPEVVVFEDPAKRKEKRLANSKAISKPTTGTSGDRESNQEEDAAGLMFDLKRARHEVKRLGISGLDKRAKEEAQIELAVNLGAKPPKNPYLNYRELQEKKKREQEEERNQNKEDNVAAKNSQGTAKSKRPKSKKNPLGYIDGQIGSYKDGVQTISKDDIHKINRSNKKNR